MDVLLVLFSIVCVAIPLLALVAGVAVVMIVLALRRAEPNPVLAVPDPQDLPASAVDTVVLLHPKARNPTPAARGPTLAPVDPEDPSVADTPKAPPRETSAPPDHPIGLRRVITGPAPKPDEFGRTPDTEEDRGSTELFPRVERRRPPKS